MPVQPLPAAFMMPRWPRSFRKAPSISENFTSEKICTGCRQRYAAGRGILKKIALPPQCSSPLPAGNATVEKAIAFHCIKKDIEDSTAMAFGYRLAEENRIFLPYLNTSITPDRSRQTCALRRNGKSHTHGY
jgi:hypothetical protein